MSIGLSVCLSLSLSLSSVSLCPFSLSLSLSLSLSVCHMYKPQYFNQYTHHPLYSLFPPPPPKKKKKKKKQDQERPATASVSERVSTIRSALLGLESRGWVFCRGSQHSQSHSHSHSHSQSQSHSRDADRFEVNIMSVETRKSNLEIENKVKFCPNNKVK